MSESDASLNEIRPFRFDVEKEIRRYQHSTELLCRALPFKRLVVEVLQEIDPTLRIQLRAVQALQHSAEDYLVRLFQDTNAECLPTGRTTIKPKHMRLALKVQKVRKLKHEIKWERKQNSAKRYNEFRDAPKLPVWEWFDKGGSGDSSNDSMSEPGQLQPSDEDSSHYDTWSENDDKEYMPVQ